MHATGYVGRRLPSPGELVSGGLGRAVESSDWGVVPLLMADIRFAQEPPQMSPLLGQVS